MNFSIRYFYVPDGSITSWSYDLELKDPVFDDVVDRSSFRPNSENVRQSVLSGSGFVEKGVFDDMQNPPSDVQVLIRSGKLDKAEIDDYVRSESERLNDEIDKENKSAELKRELDKITSSVQDNTEQNVGIHS